MLQVGILYKWDIGKANKQLLWAIILKAFQLQIHSKFKAVACTEDMPSHASTIYGNWRRKLYAQVGE